MLLNKTILKRILYEKNCLNPLKSGHCYWINWGDDKKYERWLWWVLIPLNRVIVIEWIIWRRIWRLLNSRKLSLNPLKSGHCYWIIAILQSGNYTMEVLIPLNRVIVIESARAIFALIVFLLCLNPLKSGHCYWIENLIK